MKKLTNTFKLTHRNEQNTSKTWQKISYTPCIIFIYFYLCPTQAEETRSQIIDIPKFKFHIQPHIYRDKFQFHFLSTIFLQMTFIAFYLVFFFLPTKGNPKIYKTNQKSFSSYFFSFFSINWFIGYLLRWRWL
jgi:hypothetical protein